MPREPSKRQTTKGIPKFHQQVTIYGPLLGQCSLGNRGDVNGVYRVRNLVLVNDHDLLRAQRNEVAVRDGEFSPIRQADGEGPKPVMQPTSDLIQDHAATFTNELPVFKLDHLLPLVTRSGILTGMTVRVCIGCRPVTFPARSQPLQVPA